ncbi:MAG TPA: T9SS type A sorting domain-containing protein, partial [Bacteroidales bacterium]|nr:T9SS type A sorting domain-containing protein [Bacteroidales bacterium]
SIFTICFVLFIATILSAQTPVVPAGSGTENDPYQIATLDNLYWMSITSSSWDKYFEQTNDINANFTSAWNSGAGWDPIGYVNSEADYLAFTGSYDGGGFLIENIYINRPTEMALGFFAIIENANISNMLIADIWIAGNEFVGSLTGFNFSSEITNCHAINGEIEGVNDIGGLVGRNESGNEYIYSCTFSGAITSSGENIGGLIGKNKGTVRKCFADADISGIRNLGCLIGENDGSTDKSNGTVDSCYTTGQITFSVPDNSGSAGGLIGQSKENTVISYCYSNATINGESISQNLGGLIGLSDNTTTVSYCFAEGNVTGGGSLGGLVGQNSYSNINNCYARGNVSGTQNNVGGVVGRNTGSVEKSYSTGVITSSGGCYGGLLGSNEDSGSASLCFWDTETSSVGIGCGWNGGGSVDITGKTSLEMKTLATYTNAGWDFYGETTNGNDDNWHISSVINNGYPCFKWYTDIVGVEENIAINDGFSVFPNPSSNFVTISNNTDLFENVNIVIYTISGEKVFSEELVSIVSNIDVRHLSNGIYILEINSSSFSKRQKIIVQK